MSAEPLTVLVVDDDPDMLALIETALQADHTRVLPRLSGEAALETLGVEPVDIVVSDILMHGMNGLDLCARIVEARPEVPVIVVTASSKLDPAGRGHPRGCL